MILVCFISITTAVVALMKKSGASNKLTYLIILEALLNDGSALVLYNLFFPLIEKNSSPLVATEVVIYAVRVVVISPLLGIGIGMLSLMLITIANKRMQEDDIIVQVASTLCCAYFSFFIAEYSCNVSGILSCCSAGILLAIFAPTRILSHETMHNVWNSIEWIGNTVLFMLAGLLYGDKSFRYTQASDLARLVILYLLVFVVRFVMITFFYPVLSRIGIRCSWNESLFMTFGGLRGAVSIALALSLLRSVESGETILSATDGRRIFFLCGGVSALTLIINAVTSSKVLKGLGLVSDEIAIDWKVMLHFIKKRLRQRALRTLAHLKKSNPELFDESVVRSYCSILSFQSTLDLPIDWSVNLVDTVKESEMFVERKIADVDEEECMRPSVNEFDCLDPMRASYDSGPSDSLSDVSLIEDAGARDSDDDITLEVSCSWLRPINEKILGNIRRVFLDVVRVSYWKQIKLGKLPRQSIAARILLSSIDFGLETIHTPGLQDWENIVDDHPFLFPKDESTSIFSRQNWNLHSDWNYPAKLFFSWQEKQVSCVLTSFLEAHAHARRQIPHYLGETEGIDTPEESLVVQESEQLAKEALLKLSKIPSVAMIALRSKQYAAFILHEQEDVIVEFQAEGILTEKYAKLLLAEVHQDYSQLQHDEWWPLCLQVVYRRLCRPRCPSRNQQS